MKTSNSFTKRKRGIISENVLIKSLIKNRDVHFSDKLISDTLNNRVKDKDLGLHMHRIGDIPSTPDLRPPKAGKIFTTLDVSSSKKSVKDFSRW